MKLIYFSLIFVVSSNLYAACSGNHCRDVTIDRIYMYPNSNILRIGTSGEEMDLDCAAYSDKYITLDMSQEYAKEAYSTILSAHQTRSNFWLRTTGAGTDCSIVYIVSDT
jgi:hypothetical protein